jgi:hypothetical protein
MLHSCRITPKSDEIKVYVFPEFLEATRGDLLARMKEKEDQLGRERIERIGRIEQENMETIGIWGSLDAWNDIYNTMENPAYEIAGKSLNDENNPAFFSDIYESWEMFSARRQTIMSKFQKC